jgi:hypothetical protein
MAKEVESVNTFTRDRKYRLNKDITIVRCDDGMVYEFEEVEGAPAEKGPRLRKSIRPDGSFAHTTARKILPGAVEETMETMFGGWSK